MIHLPDSSVFVLHFVVSHDEDQTDDNEIPLVFSYPFPDLKNSDIKILQIDKSILLQNEQNKEFQIALFLDNKKEGMTACQSLKFIKNDFFVSSKCQEKEDAVLLIVIMIKMEHLN